MPRKEKGSGGLLEAGKVLEGREGSRGRKGSGDREGSGSMGRTRKQGHCLVRADVSSAWYRSGSTVGAQATAPTIWALQCCCLSPGVGSCFCLVSKGLRSPSALLRRDEMLTVDFCHHCPIPGGPFLLVWFDVLEELVQQLECGNSIPIPG